MNNRLARHLKMAHEAIALDYKILLKAYRYKRIYGGYAIEEHIEKHLRELNEDKERLAAMERSWM